MSVLTAFIIDTHMTCTHHTHTHSHTHTHTHTYTHTLHSYALTHTHTYTFTHTHTHTHTHLHTHTHMHTHTLIQRWFIDANIKCFAYGGHAPLGLLAIAVLLICVLLIPTAVLFSLGKIQVNRPLHFTGEFL